MMKAIILAGGVGSRLLEETVARPKPMVDIGGKPILWHIMSIFSSYGITEFIIALGYRGELIKEYFLNFYALNNNITLDLATGTTTIHDGGQPNWKVHLVDTGLKTETGGRLKRLASWLGDDTTFMMTYGDGVASVDLCQLVRFHESHGKLATVTTVRPPARFGGIELRDGHRVGRFTEKPQAGEGWINGGFFVLNRGVVRYIDGDDTLWERSPMERLAEDGELMAFRHEGFWQPMDTLRDRKTLEELWATGSAPWKTWGRS
jgi:glucose-1-phosphate cytidylyltransferase